MGYKRVECLKSIKHSTKNEYKVCLQIKKYHFVPYSAIDFRSFEFNSSVFC